MACVPPDVPKALSSESCRKSIALTDLNAWLDPSLRPFSPASFKWISRWLPRTQRREGLPMAFKIYTKTELTSRAFTMILANNEVYDLIFKQDLYESYSFGASSVLP